MNKLFEKLENFKILVSDGAWGTELIKSGINSNICPEILNLENPDKVFNIAKQYIEAGSDIISTNSFGASKIKLNSYSLSNKTYIINKTAAEISKKAAGDKLVMGSIGPCGKFLLTDEINESELEESFYLQIKGLVDGGVDCLLFETFYDLDELSIGINIAKDFTNIPIICSLTFNKNNDGNFFTLMGNSIENAFEELLKFGANIVGVNCGNGFNTTIEILKQIKLKFPSQKLIVQPNAGLPELVSEKIIYTETPEKIVTAVENYLELGVSIIGGCCGTTQEHIKTIRKLVDQWRNKNR
ncbi:MAG: homocysteine S-methyltransferase family protein [Ignavibacterium sp.]|nr:homocysteine S-methyltransferase family protein [Ignavibacterium sp.]